MKGRQSFGGVLLLLSVCCLFLCSCGGVAGEGLTNDFFAMDTGTIDANHISAAAQVQMVKELGYAGIAYWEGNPKRGSDGLTEMLRELDNAGLKIYPLYFGAWLDSDKPKYEAGLPEAIKMLEGREAMVWLHIMSKEYEKSSPEGDERAVEIIREVAQMAAEAGVKVALYPHVNEWLETVGDAHRVVKKVDRENVGLSFNLFHHLRVVGEEDIDEVVESVMPYLFTVTINGSSEKGTIETLDKGSYDVCGLLERLKELGYEGPVGLQGWAIKGDVHENLRRSMEAWKECSARIATEKKR
jgi:sugar phosphate isomerase/epimerase